MENVQPVTEAVESGFAALQLPESLLKGLTRLGYTEPTPIQKESIPALLEGRDVLGQAATGTGKTAAFALPLLARLKPGQSKMFETSVLVLVPTRELAMQVAEAIAKYGRDLGVSVCAVYGGQEIMHQLRPLKRGVDVVVGTPGRIIDHLERKSLKFDKVTAVVLDEADEMLDLGFAEELEKILSATPKEKQVALFSATLPRRIQSIAEKHLRNPFRVMIQKERSAAGEAPKVRQQVFVVPSKQKELALVRLLQAEQPTSALVFCQTREDVDGLASTLQSRGFATEAIHGGLDQVQRDRVMKRFKTGAVKVLVATDVAARGLHVDDLSHVVNFDVPKTPEVYVHRIGRTGRAGKEGVALTLVQPGEVRLVRGLEKAVGSRIEFAQVPDAAKVAGVRVSEVQKSVLEAAAKGLAPATLAWVASKPGDLSAEQLAAAAMELLVQHRFGSDPIEDEIIAPYRAASSTARPTGGASNASTSRFNRNDRRPAAAGPMPEARRPSAPRAAAASHAPRAESAWHVDRAHAPRHADAAPGPSAGPASFSADRSRPARSWKEQPGTGAQRPDRPAGTHRPERAGERPDRRGPPRATTTIFLGAGKETGLRPGDVVGAIANEAGLESKDIGPIQISDRFTLVDVPSMDASRVVQVMRGTTLRGRKVIVRLENKG